MHIALLTAEYPPRPGGVGDYTRRLAQALRQPGSTVSVITGQDIVPPVDIGIAVYPLVRGWDWRSWQDVIALLDQLRPAVLHIQYQTGAYGMHPAINLLPWRLRALGQHGIRVVVTFHDVLEPYLFPKAHRVGARQRVTRQLAADSDAVIATNPGDAAVLAQMVPHQQVHTIPIGSNIPMQPPSGYQRDLWRMRLGVAPGELLVAYFGMLSPAKGFDMLLEIVPLLPGVRLLLIGGAAAAPHDQPYAEQVRARIEELALNGVSIIQTGHVAPGEVSAHLLAADVVVLPFREGVSFRSGSLLAALEHGCAVVTTASPTAPAAAPAFPTLQDGEHALLVPPDDIHALAAALRRCLTDHGLRASLGYAARHLAPYFGWSAIAARHHAIYARQHGLCSTPGVVPYV
ncbi:MAG: glycosyltransferase family 4 protein [Chloroflexaceae bacterium]|nr:glycosyltransferase family 4 protein [Chloroflexaceae bacterium]